MMAAPKNSNKPHLFYWRGRWRMQNWMFSTGSHYEAAYQWMQRANGAAPVPHTPCTASRPSIALGILVPIPEHGR